MQKLKNVLKAKRLGIDTYKEAVIYIHKDCHICRSEGFESQARITVKSSCHEIVATLNTINTDILSAEEVGFSEYAWQLLNAQEGEMVSLSYTKPLESLSYVRSKIYGHELTEEQIGILVKDIVAGYLSDIHISSFLTACAAERLNKEETLYLTKAMVDTGARLNWGADLVVDKHSVGGLPGNRTTLIVVPIVAAFGLMIPKTSSRAITSPAGTADTMETLAPVDLDLSTMKKVVEQESGCIVAGGVVTLSPADDILVRVERGLDLDSESQMVASVLSKKIAAGSTHVVIDMPIGATAKIRSIETAKLLKDWLEDIGIKLGLKVECMFMDGSQPVGYGIGPALEAKDVLAVLQQQKNASVILREHALELAGKVLEFSPKVKKGTGRKIAQELLDNGQAWKKFQAICEAQGGMRELTQALHKHVVISNKIGKIIAIDNRRLARLAKLAGAPQSKAAGIEMHVQIGTILENKQPLFTIHAESHGELEYALATLQDGGEIFTLEKNL